MWYIGKKVQTCNGVGGETVDALAADTDVLHCTQHQTCCGSLCKDCPQTWTPCNTARFTWSRKASEVGGNNSSDLHFLVKSWRRQLFKSLNSLVLSYITTVKRSRIDIVFAVMSASLLHLPSSTKAVVTSGCAFHACHADFFPFPEKHDTVHSMSKTNTKLNTNKMKSIYADNTVTHLVWWLSTKLFKSGVQV